MQVSEKTRSIQRIALKAGVSTRTVERWWSGEGVSAAVAYGLKRAAEDLNIERPDPEPQAEAS
jgi:DNA-binding LacI/PurR family transcriptional regulator